MIRIMEMLGIKREESNVRVKRVLDIEQGKSDIKKEEEFNKQANAIIIRYNNKEINSIEMINQMTFFAILYDKLEIVEKLSNHFNGANITEKDGGTTY